MKKNNFIFWVCTGMLAFEIASAGPQTTERKEVKVITQAKKKSSQDPLSVVQAMFAAFGKGDIENLKKTIAPNSVWTYHGPSTIPYSGVFKGPEGVARFIGGIVESVDILDFQVQHFIVQDSKVVVLGFEKQKVKKNGQILDQSWVQIYEVTSGLITKMDEFADTANAQKIFLK